MGITEEDCVIGLRKAADRLGKSPTKAEYEELGMEPAHSTILRVMDSWNVAKEKAGLETFTQGGGDGQPIRPKPDDVEIPNDSEWLDLTPQQRWYYKNREHRIAVKERRRKKLRRWMYEFKRDECRCERCGVREPPCLDFHHLGEKKADVSLMVSFGYSKSRIMAEIDRCVVLCANCHRKEHYKHEEPGYVHDGPCKDITLAECWDQYPSHESIDWSDNWQLELRKWVYLFKVASDGCTRCDEHDPTCLDFHHKDEEEKNASVSRLLPFKPSKERLREEIDKCELLCANCHRSEHYRIPIAVKYEDENEH